MRLKIWRKLSDSGRFKGISPFPVSSEAGKEIEPPKYSLDLIVPYFPKG
jgi:hypothetical protein